MAKNNEKETFDAAVKSEAFFEKYKKFIGVLIIAIIVIVGGAFGYHQYNKGRQVDASTAMARGQEYFNNDQFTQALNGDKAGYDGFLKIADKYSSTDAGNLANLYAGLCYANLGKWQEAVNYLEDYSPKGDALVSPAAVEALGNAYAHIGKIDKAIDKLKDAAKKADSKAEDGVNYSISPTFLLQAGRLLESQNKNDEALKLYQDIKKKYVNSAIVQSSEIDKFIARASNK